MLPSISKRCTTHQISVSRLIRGIAKSPRSYFSTSTEERENSSELSFHSSEVSFHSSDVLFRASVEKIHSPPSYLDISSLDMAHASAHPKHYPTGSAQQTLQPLRFYPFGYCAERKGLLTLQTYTRGVFGRNSFRKGSTPTSSYLYQDNKKR